MNAAPGFDALRLVVKQAQQVFVSLLERALRDGPVSRAQYQRYLSMQYHLTNGVQAYFLRAAAHRDMARKRALRQFLFDFANEEEQHYLVAAADLARMGVDVVPEPFDVTLWHAYFRSVVDERPFLRLGAACILENISGGPVRALVRKALQAPFLNAGNTRFLVLHQHEAIPHGDQVLDALEAAQPDATQLADLIAGARRGMVLYLRMAEWALFPDSLVATLDGSPLAATPGGDGIGHASFAEVFP